MGYNILFFNTTSTVLILRVLITAVLSFTVSRHRNEEILLSRWFTAC